MKLKLSPQIIQGIDKLKAAYKKLQFREQIMVGVAGAVIAFVGMYLFVEPVTDAFDSQMLTLVERRSQSRAFSGTVERYLKLKGRLEEIEERYKKVEFKDGVFSHLQTLLRDRAKLGPQEFKISDSPAKPFGGMYEQLPYNLKFQTSDLPALASFLEELMNGERPLIVGRLDLVRSRVGDRLEVDIDISGLQKIQK